MTDLTQSLQNLDLFANVPGELTAGIIGKATPKHGQQGDVITIQPVDYFVLIEGEARLISRDNTKAAAKITAQLSSSPGEPPDWLYALPAQQLIQLSAPSHYVILDGEEIDAAIDQAQQRAVIEQAGTDTAHAQTTDTGAAAPSDMKKLTDWLRRSPAFAKMDLFDLVECAMALQPMQAGADWDIVREGSEGNFFYLIESGRAEVWRPNPVEESPAVKVADLGPGDSFGEEALLQDAYRNATVRMVEAGRLWRLEKSQFDELLRDSLLQEIDAQAAMAEVQAGKASLVDCRNRTEYAITHIPGAALIPLDEIRERAAGLDKSGRYHVYCRSGKRSKAAAFLMQRMGLNAKSIRGGITAWPFDVAGDD